MSTNLMLEDEKWILVQDLWERFYSGRSKAFQERYSEDQILTRIERATGIPRPEIEELLTT